MGAQCSNVGKWAWWLMVVGSVNWGLIGLGSLLEKNWNVVGMVLGRWVVVENLVYLLVGLSAVYLLTRKCCK